MTHIGPRVRERRRALGWTILQLATRSGMDSGFISKIERGSVGYTHETEKKLAEALNCSVSFFHSTSAKLPDDVTEVVPSDYRKVPMLSYSRASEVSGLGFSATGDEIAKGAQVALQYSAKTYSSRVESQDMLPEFKVGETLIFDPQVAPDPGDLVHAKVDGQVYLRVYRQLGTGEKGEMIFSLAALNPNFPTFRSDRNSIEIIATMMEQRLGRFSRR